MEENKEVNQNAIEINQSDFEVKYFIWNIITDWWNYRNECQIN